MTPEHVLLLLFKISEKPVWPKPSPYQIIFKVTVSGEKPDIYNTSTPSTTTSGGMQSMLQRCSSMTKGTLGTAKGIDALCSNAL